MKFIGFKQENIRNAVVTAQDDDVWQQTVQLCTCRM